MCSYVERNRREREYSMYVYIRLSNKIGAFVLCTTKFRELHRIKFGLKLEFFFRWNTETDTTSWCVFSSIDSVVGTKKKFLIKLGRKLSINETV